MTSTLQQILDSKRALRRELASLPVSEKLRMLEAMKERELEIHPESPLVQVAVDAPRIPLP